MYILLDCVYLSLARAEQPNASEQFRRGCARTVRQHAVLLHVYKCVSLSCSDQNFDLVSLHVGPCSLKPSALVPRVLVLVAQRAGLLEVPWPWFRFFMHRAAPDAF